MHGSVRLFLLTAALSAGITETTSLFERDVLPILAAKCSSCHGPQKTCRGRCFGVRLTIAALPRVRMSPHS